MHNVHIAARIAHLEPGVRSCRLHVVTSRTTAMEAAQSARASRDVASLRVSTGAFMTCAAGL